MGEISRPEKDLSSDQIMSEGGLIPGNNSLNSMEGILEVTDETLSKEAIEDKYNKILGKIKEEMDKRFGDFSACQLAAADGYSEKDFVQRAGKGEVSTKGQEAIALIEKYDEMVERKKELLKKAESNGLEDLKKRLGDIEK